MHHLSSAFPTRSVGSKQERGMVLLYALIGLILVIGVVLASGEREDAVRSLTQTEFDADARARSAAESGLVDALSWLRRQFEQPVPAFAPQRDMSLDPPLNETDDAEVGLVREFLIARGYWGQYKVRSGTPAEPFFDENQNGIFDKDDTFQDLDGNGERTMANGCRDLSFDRGAFKSGVIWYLESEGSVYKRLDEDLPLGEGRNARLAHITLSTEVRRLSLILPTSAGIVVGKASDAKFEGTVIESTTQAIAYRPETGVPQYITADGNTKRVEFRAPVEHAPVDGWITGDDNNHTITCQDVFGVSIQTLRSMADYNVQLVSKIPKNSMPLDEYLMGEMILEELPITIPENSLTVITPKDGTLKIDKNESIIGRGIIVIDGNLEVKEDTLTNFSGVLFVSGDMKVTKAGAFEGMVIVGKKLEVQGELPAFKVKKSGRKKKSKKSWKSHKSKKSKKSIKVKPDNSVWFGHDPDLVADLVMKIGNYRKYKASFAPPYVTTDGRPDEAFGTSASLSLPGGGK